jgi:hypothetical protein
MTMRMLIIMIMKIVENNWNNRSFFSTVSIHSYKSYNYIDNPKISIITLTTIP